MEQLNKNELPIAVIDSGVGGISVLRELLRILPNESFLYYGDSKNAPYGSKEKEEVLAITKKNLEMLQSIGIKALVVACNTATSAAVRILRQEHPELVIVGIEPAIKPPADQLDHPRVLVMATPLTLKEEKFKRLVERYSNREEIIPLPCPHLAEMIESGKIEGEEIDEYIASLLEPYRDQGIDALVLGCTHYPHVIEIIERHVPTTTRIFDGGEGTARETHRRLEIAGLLNPRTAGGTVEILNSANDQRMIELSQKLLFK